MMLGPGFPDFVDLLDLDTLLLQAMGGAPGGIDLEAQVLEVLGQGRHQGLVRVLDGKEHPAGEGQDLARGQLGLGEGQAEVLVDAHDLAGGSHLRPQEGSTPGKRLKGKTDSFTAK